MTGQSKHIAITIGPIVETIMLSSRPSAMWASSFMFSYAARRLCELIITENLAEYTDFIVPYFDKNSVTLQKDGIGLFHDHIIFQTKDSEQALDKLNECFKQVSDEISLAFSDDSAGVDKEWFEQYFQFHALEIPSSEVGNVVTGSGKYLDLLEYEKSFPQKPFDKNPILHLYEGDEKLDDDKEDERIAAKRGMFKNARIRTHFMTTFKLEDTATSIVWGESEGGEEYRRTPDLEDISGRYHENSQILSGKSIKRQKINSYYAIIQADGDKFGEYIGEQEDLRGFSKKCLKYSSSVVEIVKKYGGMPIYAGGDDLLFIAPLTKNKLLAESYGDGHTNINSSIKFSENSNIFDLIQALRQNFEDDAHFGKGEGRPTLSFGVAIAFYKYPLYESFEEARQMLEEVKTHKSRSGAEADKNALAISLLKHSGKAVKFVIEKFNTTEVTGKIARFIEDYKGDEAILKSISHLIWQHKELFELALKQNLPLTPLFENTFDSAEHKDKNGEIKKEIKDIQILLEEIKGIGKVRVITEKTSDLKTLDSLLRFVKFWQEEGEEG